MVGNMGKVFEIDWEPTFGENIELRNFSQLMTTSSGRVEVRYSQEYMLTEQKT